MNRTDFDWPEDLVEDDEYDDDDDDDDDDDEVRAALESERERIEEIAAEEFREQTPTWSWSFECLAIQVLADSYDVVGEPDVDEDGNLENGSLREVFRLDRKQALAEAFRRFRSMLRRFVSARRLTPAAHRRPRERRFRRTRTAARGSPSDDLPLPSSAALLAAEGRAA